MAGRMGDVFLRMVRVEREVKAARKEEATGAEKAELERVGELFAAGERAVRAGEREVAGGLFEQCEAALGAWKEGVASIS